MATSAERVEMPDITRETSPDWAEGTTMSFSLSQELMIRAPKAASAAKIKCFLMAAPP